MNTTIETRVDLTGALVITVSGSLENGGAVALSEAVSAAVDQLQPDVVHVDLGLVTCVDLVGAAALTQARRSAGNCGTRVVLRNPTADVTRSRRCATTASQPTSGCRRRRRSGRATAGRPTRRSSHTWTGVSS